MQVKFTLTLNNVVVDGISLDALVIDWIDQANHERLLAISRDWNCFGCRVLDNMTGLTRVGEMSLAMEAA